MYDHCIPLYYNINNTIHGLIWRKWQAWGETCICLAPFWPRYICVLPCSGTDMRISCKMNNLFNRIIRILCYNLIQNYSIQETVHWFQKTTKYNLRTPPQCCGFLFKNSNSILFLHFWIYANLIEIDPEPDEYTSCKILSTVLTVAFTLILRSYQFWDVTAIIAWMFFTGCQSTSGDAGFEFFRIPTNTIFDIIINLLIHAITRNFELWAGGWLTEAWSVGILIFFKTGLISFKQIHLFFKSFGTLEIVI